MEKCYPAQKNSTGLLARLLSQRGLPGAFGELGKIL
jgi:hypothetical protein